MKRKIFSLLFVLCLLLPSTCLLSGCGEQYIEERTYNLLGMTVIKDNTTPLDEGYGNFAEGEYGTTFCGGMSIWECQLEVTRKSLVLKFDDTKYTGIQASFQFDVYTGSDVYPAYTFEKFSVTRNDVDITTLSENEISELPYEAERLYREVKYFGFVCSSGDTSIQLITQNKSLACHIIVKNVDDESLVFMSMLYGY